MCLGNFWSSAWLHWILSFSNFFLMPSKWCYTLLGIRFWMLVHTLHWLRCYFCCCALYLFIFFCSLPIRPVLAAYSVNVYMFMVMVIFDYRCTKRTHKINCHCHYRKWCLADAESKRLFVRVFKSPNARTRTRTRSSLKQRACSKIKWINNAHKKPIDLISIEQSHHFLYLVILSVDIPSRISLPFLLLLLLYGSIVSWCVAFCLSFLLQFRGVRASI